jgi:TRAP-type C4-dicarboxylate transport system substrate-binding protein
LGLLALGSAGPGVLAAEPQVQLRVVGGLATVNQYTRHEAPFWTQSLQRLSQGRYSAEIVPFDRAGIRGQEVLALIGQGAVPFGTLLVALHASSDPEIAGMDLAGLSPDIAALKRIVAGVRPALERSLREKRGVELLALYAYPAQVLFCRQPIDGLAGIAGRRVRTSSATQSDLVQSLGGTPVPTGFAAIVPQFKAGNLDCAITGTMSGNTIGLHEVTTHIHALPLSWGLSIFAANGGAWNALPADLKALLKRELPKLESAIWQEAERETTEGIACNVGGAACTSGKRGSMVVVPASAADERLRQRIFSETVLPRWLARCGAECAAFWNDHLAPAAGVRAH